VEIAKEGHTAAFDQMEKVAGRSFDIGRKTLLRSPPRLLGALDPGGFMRRTSMTRAVMLGLLALLVLPATGLADTFDAAGKGLPDSVGINSLWVIVAGCFVMFMQAGFAFLEIGFSRGKNAGTVVAKILTNFSIAAILYWAVGFAFAFGGDLGHIIGTNGFFLRDFGDPQKAFPIMGLSDATIESKWFFQFVFCAVSLAIVWGTTLERIKFGVYVIYAVVFSALIYPIASGWVFGGGWLQVNLGMQDFAGSTAVHLIGATGALAALLLLGPRRGKYGHDGKARAIPGHNMPLFGLGVLILWLGWFGFNPGSTLGALDGRFTEVLLVTQIAASAGVLGAIITARLKTGQIDIGMAGNGAIGALVAITAPSGYVAPWAALVIGFVAGIIVPLGVYAIDRKLDDPVGALTAHGLCGVWGTLSCGLFTLPTLAAYNAVGKPGLFYSGSFHQLGVQALGVVTVFAFVLAASYGTFWAIKKTYGLRVTAEEEDAGLDISEHGMYGYPEQFIPTPELVGYGAAPHVAAPAAAAAPVTTSQEVPA
jgi:Amt family ammonium transporter